MEGRRGTHLRQLAITPWQSLLVQTLREAAQRGANASPGERRPAETLGATGQEILDAFEVRHGLASV